jgi:hypothetical protein
VDFVYSNMMRLFFHFLIPVLASLSGFGVSSPRRRSGIPTRGFVIMPLYGNLEGPNALVVISSLLNYQSCRHLIVDCMVYETTAGEYH